MKLILLLPDLRSKNFFNEIFTIFTMGPNPLLQTGNGIIQTGNGIIQTGNGIIQTGNGINSPTFRPQIKKTSIPK